MPLSSTPILKARGLSDIVSATGALYYASAKDTEARDRIVTAANAFEPMREALQAIAAQKIGSEIGDEAARDNADYEFAYVSLVAVARAALKLAGDAT